MDVGTGASHEQEPKRDQKAMLSSFCDKGFDGSMSACGLALGRPTEELQSMLDGDTAIDEDLLMKMRGIADERGIDIGSF